MTSVYRVAKCEHTGGEVVQVKEDWEDDAQWLCLHNDREGNAPIEDAKQVALFKKAIGEPKND